MVFVGVPWFSPSLAYEGFLHRPDLGRAWATQAIFFLSGTLRVYRLVK